MEYHVYDLIGIGSGVFNLSLAALLDEQKFDNIIFFEKKPSVLWHDGLLLETSALQVSFLKDLVTLVDPTSKYSYLNYLKVRNILYQFINRKSNFVSRNQFQYYFRWVAEQIPFIKFNSKVSKIEYDGQYFMVTVNNKIYKSYHIAVATGITPIIPDCTKPFLGEKIFHIYKYNTYKKYLIDQDILIVGGGQSGAEVFYDQMLLNNQKSISWYGKRIYFGQLEDNSFVNDYYTPSFVKSFQKLTFPSRRHFLDKLSLSCNGINEVLINNIYSLIFERRFFSDRQYKYHISPGYIIDTVELDNDKLIVKLRHWDNQPEVIKKVDRVILATGFMADSFNMLKNILDPDITLDSLKIKTNFELEWKNMNQNHIFIQNTSMMAIGPADPNLSIAAWRAAMIVNTLLNKELYTCYPDSPIINYI